MKKSKILRRSMAIAMALVAVVLSVSFSSCGEEDLMTTGSGSQPVNPGGDKPTNPEMYVFGVTNTSCSATNIEWKSENVTLSRAYADADQDGYINATVTHKYSVEIEYRDKNGINGAEYKEASQTYTSSLFCRVFGLNNNMVFESLEALEATTGNVSKVADESNYELYAINFGGSKQIVLKQSASLSTSALSFEGKTKTDLCDASFIAPTYDSKSYTEVTSDKEGYKKYEMTVKVKIQIANVGNNENVRYLVFKVNNVYIKTNDGGNGGDIPVVPTEKEVIAYKVINNNFINGYTKGDIVAIYDDLSEDVIGSFNVGLKHSTVVPADVEQNGLSDLSWSQGNTTSVELAATGNNREINMNKNFTIAITEVFTSMTNRSKVPMTFKGLWETARVNFPDGTSQDLLSGGYELEDGEVEEISSTENSKTIQHSVYASFNSGTPELLKANVVLNKSSEPDVKEAEVTILIENFEVRDKNYVFEVVQYWTISEPTRTSVSIPHSADIWAENEKETSSRNYNTTTPAMEAGSVSNYNKTVNGTKGNFTITGKITNYTSNFSFEGVDVKVSSKYLNYFEIVSAAGHKAVWDLKTSAIKTGVTMGTKDLGDESQHIYKDKLHFALPINSVNVATCEQALKYTEGITTPPEDKPEEPTTDIDASIVENTIDYINSDWTARMKVTITNNKGETRDTTMTRVYSKAGVNYGSIADFISENNSFTLPTISKDGSATTEKSGEITYSTQKYNSVADKFTQKISVINGSSSVVLAGKTLYFKSTEITVAATDKGQAETSSFNNGYDVWASSINYRHGFASHFDNETTKFNILVERAPVHIEIDGGGKFLKGAITVTVDNETNPMISLVISQENQTLIYSSAFSFKTPTEVVDLSQKPVIAKAMTFKDTPSAVNFGTGSNREPANLQTVTGQWCYTNASGSKRLVSIADTLIDGYDKPIIAVGEVLKDGSFKIKNGNDTIIFKVK